MSAEAVRWALQDAEGVPPACVAILLGLAWHADTAGRNAYPSEQRLARYSRKSVRQVRRDLRELEAHGLIRHGDPAAVPESILRQYRPTVYDLALDRTPTSALDRSPVSDLDRSPASGPDRTPKVARPDTGDQPDRTPMSAKEDRKSLRRKADQRAHANHDAVTAAVAALQEMTGRTVTDEHAALVVQELTHGRAVQHAARYVRASIVNDPNPARFLPTPPPPRFSTNGANP